MLNRVNLLTCGCILVMVQHHTNTSNATVIENHRLLEEIFDCPKSNPNCNDEVPSRP